MKLKTTFVLLFGPLVTGVLRADYHELNSVELELFELLRDHQSQRRSIMQLDPRLCRIAREHCESMNENDFFSHDDPTTGKNANDRARDAGYPVPSFYRSGDNFIESIALNAPDSASLVVTQWEKSEGHRTHVLGLQTSSGQEFYSNQLLIGIGYVRKTGIPQGYDAFVSAHVPSGEQAATWQLPSNFSELSFLRDESVLALTSLPPFGVCCIHRLTAGPQRTWEMLGCGVADEEGRIELPFSSQSSGIYRITWEP